MTGIIVDLAQVLITLCLSFLLIVVRPPVPGVLGDWPYKYSIFEQEFFLEYQPKAWSGWLLFLLLLLAIERKWFFLALKFFRSLDFWFFSSLWLWDQRPLFFSTNEKTSQVVLALRFTAYLITICQSCKKRFYLCNWARMESFWLFLKY